MTISTDEQLISKLPGFTNKYIDVNGTTLHVVEGGQGMPLLLLPGWPQTWWAYHKLMPLLVKHFKVIAIDVRGMGSSTKPENGYDKKNMALDIYELVKHYGFNQVCIAGHDISTTIIHSFAAQFQQVTAKVVFLDTWPIDEDIYRLPMLPPPGNGAGSMYPWWLAFNQVKDLPEKLLENRSHILLDYLFDNLTADRNSLTAEDRLVYTSVYDKAESIRAANQWYQAFPQDVIDSKNYGKLAVPVLGIASEGNHMLDEALGKIVDNHSCISIAGSGHFIMEEKPVETAEAMIKFLL
ncbi:pimeloyl-ACP methyl ester carboxylesterase [Pedobacter psychrotolerans]|uniref:Epoxide hydrolase n=1 Tax=Pedobacter psychrotolerans TaxID=1843235 RepID=A0A4R2HDB2_9SPHI|nr:alpha/beta hydrolase [Pedobacter psychrotolerans]TCO25354.1 pimeloyl-ACP methyl ester carboxylesterase [Pedobacter psychrotolerans]GGE46169.1 epoxide hydrolase [Pedobacter psychrotolerans]